MGQPVILTHPAAAVGAGRRPKIGEHGAEVALEREFSEENGPIPRAVQREIEEQDWPK